MATDRLGTIGDAGCLRDPLRVGEFNHWENIMRWMPISMAAASCVLTLAQPSAGQNLASQVVGVWKYMGVTITEVASGKVNKPFGDRPNGYVIYTKGGHLLWSVVGGDRAKPAAGAVSDAEAILLFRTLSAGSGTYKVEGSVITSTYDSSSDQLRTGTSQKRNIEIVGSKMTQTVTGPQSVAQLAYDRVE